MRQKGNRAGEDRFVEGFLGPFNAGNRSVLLGIGDDAAVVKASGKTWAISVDACVEGIHFDPSFVRPEFVGARALGAAMSDLAAMGATPRYFLVSVECPRPRAADRMRRVYRGFRPLIRSWGLRLIGGNLSRGSRLSIHTTVIGEAGERGVLTRKGARPGDDLYVSGFLGSAARGLRFLREGARTRTAADRQAVRKFLSPTPKIEEARFLLRHGLATAAMDISDGLLLDLSRLCRASGVGASLELERVPRQPGATLREALTGGEDYELLVAVRPRALSRLRGETRRDFDARFTRIGRIERAGGVRIHFPDGRDVSARQYGRLGWDHWKS